MKDYKYKTTFAAKILPIDSEKGQNIISFASKNSNLSKLLPKDVNLTDNIGFQLFESEAFLVNVLNLNCDGVKTSEGIKLKESAPLGFIDLEHDRTKLVGVIVDSNYTDIITGKRLLEIDIKDTDKPFAVSITGIVWRAPNPDLADTISNINSPDSEFRDEIYCSWEVLFDDYNLLIIDKDKFNFIQGKLITDKTEIDELSKKLQCYGGTGLTTDGKKIGRVPTGDIVCLGVGLVEHPAGQLSPIVVNTPEETIANTVIVDTSDFGNIIREAIIKKIEEESKPGGLLDFTIKLQNNENKISQANKEVVNQNIDYIAINKISKMKIEKIEQLTDENLKEVGVAGLKELFASATKDFVDSKIKDIYADYVSKLEEKDKAIKASQEAAETLKLSVEDLNQKITKASDDLNKVLSENALREQTEAFSARMESIENDFDLDDKQKEIVANKVKTLATDADFTNYLAEIEVLLAAKKKKPAFLDKKDGDKENAKDDKKEAKANLEIIDATAIADALKNADKDKAILPNAAAGSETLMERSKKAFGLDGWNVVNKRKNRA